MAKKRLLICAHAPSDNTQRLLQAVLRGANHADIENVEVESRSPLDTLPEHVMAADALMLGTTENLGYMAGLTKDFFDRCYYPCLEQKQGMPFAYWIRAGHDGTGTRRAIDTIVTGLRWRQVQAPLVCRGDFDEAFVEQCETLGLSMAASLDAGII